MTDDLLGSMYDLLSERKAHQIDKAWIDGIRKGWKAWVKEAKTFKVESYTLKTDVKAKPPTRRNIIAFLWKKFGYNYGKGKGDEREITFMSSVPEIGIKAYDGIKFKEESDEYLLKVANRYGFEEKRKPKGQWHNEFDAWHHIKDQGKRAQAVLEKGRNFLKRLKSDLLITKGMWATASPTGRKKKKKIKNLVTRHKTKVVDELESGLAAISDGISTIKYWVRETDPEKGDRRREVYDTQDNFNRTLRTLANWTTEKAIDADNAVSGRLLRHLSTLVGQEAKASGKKGTIDWGSYEPKEISLGKIKVVFRDTEMRFQPRGRHPRGRKDFVRYMKKAHALLNKKQLGHLWYGLIYVDPPTSRPNPYGDEFGGVGGTYTRRGDYIKIHSDPSSFVTELLVHELGHRYYYKFLSKADRGNFDRWFGKVKAATHYGSKATVEDFAEVFMNYVMGRDLDRDQIDRFKVVLGKKKRTEADDRLQAMHALIV